MSAAVGTHNEPEAAGEGEDSSGGRLAGESRLARGRAGRSGTGTGAGRIRAWRRCAILLEDDFAAILLDVKMPEWTAFRPPS